MKRMVAWLLLAGMAGLLLSGPALAKDEVLERDLVALEKSYIPPLFFTSAKALPVAVKSMQDYCAAWQAFVDKYYFYRADDANWQSYFDRMELAVQAAGAIVKQAMLQQDPTILPLAHEELEAVRMEMLQLRPRNGFPKFITDKMTFYHEPMEHIVLSLKGKTPAELDAALLDELGATLEAAQKAWSEVVKCPVDGELWGLAPQQMNAYYGKLLSEGAALDAFAAALASGDKLAIIQAGVAIKPPFVEAYKTFGNFAQYLP